MNLKLLSEEIIAHDESLSTPSTEARIILTYCDRDTGALYLCDKVVRCRLARKPDDPPQPATLHPNEVAKALRRTNSNRP